jgi:hypothetical protein
MSVRHEAPLFPRLTGAGDFRMLHGWRTTVRGPGSCPAARRHRFVE